MHLTQRESMPSCVFRTAGPCLSELCVSKCVSVPVCCLDLSVSGIFSGTHVVVLLQINVCYEALVKISPNLPGPGEGSEEPMLALWEGVSRHHLPPWGPRPLALQVAEDWKGGRGAKG